MKKIYCVNKNCQIFIFFGHSGLTQKRLRSNVFWVPRGLKQVSAVIKKSALNHANDSDERKEIFKY